MNEPAGIQGPRAAGLRPLSPGRETAATPGDDFARLMRTQLEQVARMQNEAESQVQQLITGQTQNVTEVFTAARKAEVAFGLLMEIRNKLVSAYDELKQLRV